MTVDRKRFGTGNKGVAFHCADCSKDGTPGTDRYFDNREQKPKPLCVDCMMERAKNEAGALPLDSLISLNKEILDELRMIRAILCVDAQIAGHWPGKNPLAGSIQKVGDLDKSKSTVNSLFEQSVKKSAESI